MTMPMMTGVKPSRPARKLSRLVCRPLAVCTKKIVTMTAQTEMTARRMMSPSGLVHTGRRGKGKAACRERLAPFVLRYGSIGDGSMKRDFPGESAQYRAARDTLLNQEIALRREMEALAVARRGRAPGGRGPGE